MTHCFAPNIKSQALLKSKPGFVMWHQKVRKTDRQKERREKDRESSGGETQRNRETAREKIISKNESPSGLFKFLAWE